MPSQQVAQLRHSQYYLLALQAIGEMYSPDEDRSAGMVGLNLDIDHIRLGQKL